MVTKTTKLPVYDPTKDGNPFVWIIETAAKIKAQRREEARLPLQKVDYLTGKPITQPVKR